MIWLRQRWIRFCTDRFGATKTNAGRKFWLERIDRAVRKQMEAMAR